MNISPNDVDENFGKGMAEQQLIQVIELCNKAREDIYKNQCKIISDMGPTFIKRGLITLDEWLALLEKHLSDETPYASPSPTECQARS